MLRNVRPILVSFFILCFSAFAYGQDAQVQGQVLDPSGAAIAKAQVRVVEQGTGTEAKAQTNENGQYTVPGLSAGHYVIYIEASGFGAAVSDQIMLNPGQNAVMNFTLRVETTSADVVVTAEKTEERLIDVPIPVSVLRADDLAQTNQVRLRNYFDTVPGVNINPSFANQEQITIRGITTGGDTTPTVGTTIDGIPIGTSIGPSGNEMVDLDPADLARIEVLRGPQGTLYGSDSMGGVINFVTDDPSTVGYSGRVEAGTSAVSNGTAPGYSLRGSVNIPASRTLAFRLSAFDREDPGYVNDPIYHLKSINRLDSYGGHVAVLWSPTAQWSVKLSSLYNKMQQNGLDETIAEPGLGALDTNYLPGSGFSNTEVQAYSAILKGTVAGFSLTSSTGYNIVKEADGGDASMVFGVAANVPFDPWWEGGTIRNVSQELRVTKNIADRADFVLGGFYTHQTNNGGFDFVGEDLPTGQYTSTVYDYVNLAGDKYDEHAVFGSLNYHFTDTVDVQFGARESWMKVTTGATESTGILIGPSPLFTPTYSSPQSAFTYLVSPRWKITPDAMIYARFASGYRPGAPNQAQPGIPLQADPDQTRNYEVGMKGEVLNHRVSIDLSTYYIDWSNIQIQLRGPTGLTYSSNGGNAKSTGLEASVVTHPMDKLTLSGWFSYDDAALTESFPENSPGAGSTGDRLPLSSTLSGNLSAEYQTPIANRGLGVIGGDLSYIGDRYGIFGSKAAAARQYFGDYTKFDLHAGIANGGWRATAFVNNLADERAEVNGGIGFFVQAARIYIAPRTVGLDVSKTF